MTRGKCLHTDLTMKPLHDLAVSFYITLLLILKTYAPMPG